MSATLARIAITVLLVAAACVPWRSPRGGRCIEEDKPFTDLYEPLSRARDLATNAQFQREELGATLRVEDVTFETDPRVCRAISLRLGPIPSAPPSDTVPRPKYADVVVVRLGNRGYYVQSRWHSQLAGEFLCHAILMDRYYKQRTRFCG